MTTDKEGERVCVREKDGEGGRTEGEREIERERERQRGSERDRKGGRKESYGDFTAVVFLQTEPNRVSL